MATTTTNYGFDVPTSSDLVKNGATQIALLGQDLDTFLFRPFSKNAIINGGMDVWQRGTSIAVAASTVAYTADRLSISTAANQASTVSRQATNDTTNLPNIQYCARIQRNSGQTGTGTMYVGNSIETTNSIPFTGKSVTVSFYARKGADYSPTASALNLYLWNGTGTDQNVNTGYTGANVVGSVTATLTTTWQRFTFTATVPTNSTELALQYQSVPTGTASTNDYYEITGIQLEAGSQATPFARLGGTIQGELAACQRYYYRANSTGYSYFCNSANFNTASALGTVNFPVVMRTAPSFAASAGNTFMIYELSSVYAGTSIASDGTTQQTGGISVGVGSGLTAGRASNIRSNNTAAYLEYSAEL
jgi:hypothetical protein